MYNVSLSYIHHYNHNIILILSSTIHTYYTCTQYWITCTLHITSCVYIHTFLFVWPQIINSVRARFESKYQNSSILAVSGSSSLISRLGRYQQSGDGNGLRSLQQQQQYSRRSRQSHRQSHRQLIENETRIEVRPTIREPLGELNSVDRKYLIHCIQLHTYMHISVDTYVYIYIGSYVHVEVILIALHGQLFIVIVGGTFGNVLIVLCIITTIYNCTFTNDNWELERM